MISAVFFQKNLYLVLKFSFVREKLRFFILFVIFCFSCKKDPVTEDSSPALNYIPQEVKDYCYFLPGTYWVYQDSATGVLDSVAVYYAKDTFLTITNGSMAGDYEWFDVRMHNFTDGYDYYFQVNSTWSGDGRTKIFGVKTKPGNYEGETTILGHPFINGSVFYPPFANSIITVKGFFPIYNSFLNVVAVEDNNNILRGSRPTRLFFSKNFGIVEIRVMDTLEVKKLIRFNILQP